MEAQPSDLFIAAKRKRTRSIQMTSLAAWLSTTFFQVVGCPAKVAATALANLVANGQDTTGNMIRLARFRLLAYPDEREKFH